MLCFIIGKFLLLLSLPSSRSGSHQLLSSPGRVVLLQGNNLVLDEQVVRRRSTLLLLSAIGIGLLLSGSLRRGLVLLLQSSLELVERLLHVIIELDLSSQELGELIDSGKGSLLRENEDSLLSLDESHCVDCVVVVGGELVVA